MAHSYLSITSILGVHRHNHSPWTKFGYDDGYVSSTVFKVPGRDGLEASVPASHAVGRGFTARPGHTKDYFENSTNYLPTWYAGFRVGGWQCIPTV